jgi:flagellar hook-basal body complex protein FliE
MAISPVGSIGTLVSTAESAATKTASASGQPFGETLSKIVDQVEKTGSAANDAVGKMLDGTGDVHEAMIALHQSELTFQFAIQVRNKLVSAYQEIMRMQV